MSGTFSLPATPPTQQRWAGKRSLTPFALIGIALALRVGWVLYSWAAGGAEFAYPDEDVHWQLARNLVQHGWLITDDGRLAARMPAYPLFLALFAGLGTSGVLVARLAQAVVGAATVGVAWRLADDTCGRRAAWVAGILTALDPFAVFFANLLLTEGLFTLIVVALTACAWRAVRSPKLDSAPPSLAPFAGVALLGAAAVMTRPSSALYLPLLWLVLLCLAHDRRRALTRLALCPVLLAVLMLPWGLRNCVALGSCAWLSTNGGATLYDAQGPQADGSSNQNFLRELPELRGLDEVALDRKLRQMAVEQMKSDPARVLRLAAVKLLRTWSPTPNVPEYRHSRAGYVGAAYTLVVLIGAAAGLLRSLVLRRRRAEAASPNDSVPVARLQALLWLPVVYFTVLHCVYIGSLRYRVPLMPLLALVAASAVAAGRTAGAAHQDVRRGKPA